MAKKKVGVKQKKKKWFTILASEEFRRAPIGETLSVDGNNLVGRAVKVNLMNLTSNPRNQNINIGFKINEIKGEEAFTNLVSYSVLPAHLKRMVRPARTKIDDSFTCVTKDNINVRIKPLFLTKKIVKSSISISLRHKSRELIIKYIKENNYSDIILNLVNVKFQRELRESLSKVYPLVLCQIKAFEKVK